MLEPVILDESQQEVATAPIDARLVVTAAAGQGKTEVVLARLESLEEQGLDVRDEVLILSFSRAAVDAVRRRAQGSGLEAVEIRTFDSFAASVLLDSGELDDVHGFGKRIRRATEVLLIGEADVDHFRHLIVDESQDLVGDRAEMVLALLGALPEDAGFTVLGDPLQGIYDFQLDGGGSESRRTSAEFLDSLIDEHRAERLGLDGHYRATSDRMRGIIPVGVSLRELGESEGTVAQAEEQLEEYRLRGGDEPPYSVQDLRDLKGIFVDLEPDETAALLTDTNYEALRLSEVLDQMGVRHLVRRRARDSGPARWVALLFREAELRKYTREEFEELRRAVPEAPTNAWGLLREVIVDRRNHRVMDVREVNRRLRAVTTPVALVPKDYAPVVVSTVHRSKGLEFDYVVHVDSPRRREPVPTTWRAIRQVYVASSRAREGLFIVTKTPYVEKPHHKHDERWVEDQFRGRGRPKPTRIEFSNEDIESAMPHSRLVEGQEVLATEDLMGTSVELRILEEPTRGNLAEYWVVAESGVILGRAAESFSRALRNNLIYTQRGQETAWPWRLCGAVVTSIETAVCDPDYTSVAGMGNSGFWLVPRLTGLVRPDWKEKTGTV